ncbi:PIG-L deacetylase family protein [Microtetraspora glauca]|uniref:PIG-L deacetylase family protein n=1 Tax=unclassified Streptomyces TaxID=2593676 RepID=UPI000B267A0D
MSERRRGPVDSGQDPDGAEAAPLAGARILLGEADPATAERIAQALREHGASTVHTVRSTDAFLEVGAAPPAPVRFWDAAVWHTGLAETETEAESGAGRESRSEAGGGAGSHEALLRLLRRWRDRHSGIPVVVTDDAPTARLAVSALRGKAADLVERSDPDALAAAVARAVAERADPLGVEGSGQGSLRMLVVGAHPDDVEIGLGGTIHRRAHSGWDVTILTMSGGGNGGDPALRRREAHRAAEVLGARLVMENLPDGSMADDRVTVEAVERVVAEVTPDVVVVHSESDTHQDHRAVHRATLVACRKVARLACYQSPSATVAYRPNRFIELSEVDVEAKLAAIAAHHSQAASRWYLDEDLLRSTARYWGRFPQTRYAEPLELVHERNAVLL